MIDFLITTAACLLVLFGGALLAFLSAGVGLIMHNRAISSLGSVLSIVLALIICVWLIV